MDMSASAPDAAPVLEIRGISKAFPNVQALNNVSLEVRRCEVLALIGENGAGKSTLLRIINGDYQADSGEIWLNGSPASFASPRAAHEAGIRVIYQEPELIPDLSVAENVFAGELPRHGRLVDWRKLHEDTRALIAQFGFEGEILPSTARPPPQPGAAPARGDLQGAQTGVRVLALDEPTSSLGDEEASRLYKIIQTLVEAGVGIIYVSHRLREVLRVANRVAVLRDGVLVGNVPAGDCCEDDLVKLMVGRQLSREERTSNCLSDVVLDVRDLHAPGVHGVTFQVNCGEVVGFAGLIGAGRTELARAIFGASPITSGEIRIDGKAVELHNPEDGMASGIGLTPEDRKHEAIFPLLSVKDNMSVAILGQLTRFRFVNRRREVELVSEQVRQLRVKTTGIQQTISKLSGGNQQKVVLGRWLARNPRLLILDEPTRGIDVGAKAEIYELVRQLAARGIGVIFISSELPEILGVADRILVMQNGRITGEMPGEGASEEAILRLAMVDHLTAGSQE